MSVTHLTFTGVDAGRPICDRPRAEDDKGVHMVYAPLDNPEFRAKVCPHCLEAYVGSFDEDELAELGDDHWVVQARKADADRQKEMF